MKYKIILRDNRVITFESTNDMFNEIMKAINMQGEWYCDNGLLVRMSDISAVIRELPESN